MKLFEIATANQNYFAPEALQRALQQSPKSRACVIWMTPDQFLKLATPGHNQYKEDEIERFLNAGELLNNIFYLGVETQQDGNLKVGGNGQSHEGRHRCRALLRRGVPKIPVLISDDEYGPGRTYRWGDTDQRPKTLSGYKRYTIPFPQTFPYAGEA